MRLLPLIALSLGFQPAPPSAAEFKKGQSTEKGEEGVFCPGIATSIKPEGA